MIKKIFLLLTLLTAFFMGYSQSVQNFTSVHYTFFYPDTFSGIETVSETFDIYWETFDEIFRFDGDSRNFQNRVVILENKNAFDTYISEKIGDTRNEYLFLKYSTPEFSELVLYLDYNTKTKSDVFFGPALNRQLFLQYLYSFVSEPPIWIRDGFQAYFENFSYNLETKKIISEDYSAWLETAKNLNADPQRKLDCGQILTAVTGTFESARFYPQAWAFVSFLLNTEKSEYQRFLFESYIFLEGKDQYNVETQQENTDRINNRFIRYISVDKMNNDFEFWLSGQYTFAELIQTGVTYYNQGKFSASKDTLHKALIIYPEDPMLLYYLGLVSYAEKDYLKAEEWYRQSLEFGAESSTVSWALGLNAYADKRYSEAKVYLETAKSVNPERYNEKATKLISSMPK